MSWLTTGEAAALFDRSADWVRVMLEDPAHADFASRVVRRGSHRQFPAELTWFYAAEGRMPADRSDLADFLVHHPLPEIERLSRMTVRTMERSA